MIQRRVFVSGRVQGVGFRASTWRESQKYKGLRGYVRNLVDERVEAVFAGKEDQVLAIVAWCKKGPAVSKVTHLEVVEEKVDPTLPLFEVQEN